MNKRCSRCNGSGFEDDNSGYYCLLCKGTEIEVVPEVQIFDILEAAEEITACVNREADSWLMVEIWKVWQAGYDAGYSENNND